MDKNINLLELAYDDINAMEKRDLVDQIKKMKGKVIVESPVKDLCHRIEKLIKRLNVVATNEKITSELLIVKYVNSNLEKCITALEKL